MPELDLFLPGTQLTFVLIGIWTLFWSVKQPQNSKYLKIGAFHMYVHKSICIYIYIIYYSIHIILGAMKHHQTGFKHQPLDSGGIQYLEILVKGLLGITKLKHTDILKF